MERHRRIELEKRGSAIVCNGMLVGKLPDRLNSALRNGLIIQGVDPKNIVNDEPKTQNTGEIVLKKKGSAVVCNGMLASNSDPKTS
jgi:hypothetical protein